MKSTASILVEKTSLGMEKRSDIESLLKKSEEQAHRKNAQLERKCREELALHDKKIELAKKERNQIKKMKTHIMANMLSYQKKMKQNHAVKSERTELNLRKSLHNSTGLKQGQEEPLNETQASGPKLLLGARKFSLDQNLPNLINTDRSASNMPILSKKKNRSAEYLSVMDPYEKVKEFIQSMPSGDSSRDSSFSTLPDENDNIVSIPHGRLEPDLSASRSSAKSRCRSSCVASIETAKLSSSPAPPCRNQRSKKYNALGRSVILPTLLRAPSAVSTTESISQSRDLPMWMQKAMWEEEEGNSDELEVIKPITAAENKYHNAIIPKSSGCGRACSNEEKLPDGTLDDMQPIEVHKRCDSSEFCRTEKTCIQEQT